MKVFAAFTALIMNDESFSNDTDGKRDTGWLQQTRVNLHAVLEKIVNNPELHWKVKLELVSMIEQLAQNCPVNLELSLPLLIKKLVQFTADERPEVEEKALQVVQSLSQSQVNFDSAVRQNLYEVVVSLPRIISQGSKYFYFETAFVYISHN